ncbi:hypothetical protein TNCV_249551 [Trichonephila clavipes]|nr:hypothetical protein TNCV_249551 [Trichonephila clavipes]
MRNKEDPYLRNLLMEGNVVEEFTGGGETNFHDKMRKRIQRSKQKIKEPTIGNARGHPGDGGLKRTELNLEANRGTRARLTSKRHEASQCPIRIRAMTSSAYNP